MNAASALPLSATLTSLVRAVPGVTTVYAAAPLPSVMATTIIAAATHRPPPADLVSVSARGDSAEILVVIGVTDDEPAPDVCRRVHGATSTFLKERGDGIDYLVKVRIGSIGSIG